MAEVLVWGQVPFTGNIPGSARLKKCCQVSKFGEEARFPSSQPITSHSHKSWMRPLALEAELIRALPLLHGRRGMIEPRQIANHSFVISVVSPWDFHGCNLSQPNFEMSTKGIFMQRLRTCLHVALQKQMVFHDFGRTPGNLPGHLFKRLGCHSLTLWATAPKHTTHLNFFSGFPFS